MDPGRLPGEVIVPLIAAEAAAAAALLLEDVRSGCAGRVGELWLAYMALAASAASCEAMLGW